MADFADLVRSDAVRLVGWFSRVLCEHGVLRSCSCPIIVKVSVDHDDPAPQRSPWMREWLATWGAS